MVAPVPRRLLLLATGALACAPAPVDPVPIQRAVRYSEPDLTPAGPDLARAAPAYVAGLGEALDLQLGPGDELAVTQVMADRGGLRHVRLQQVHDGVPVQSAELVVHADDTTFLGVNGYLTDNLENFDVLPGIEGDQAAAIARADRAGGEALRVDDEERALVILPAEESGAALAWRVELFNHRQTGFEPARWVYFIDARAGSILRAFDALATEQASGPGGNPKVPRRWTSELDVEPHGDRFAMQSDLVTTYDLAGGTGPLPSSPVVGPLDPIADAAIDDAHGFSEVTYAMLFDWYRYEVSLFLAIGVVNAVHYDHDYENAFFNGAQVVYGDGGDHLYPLSGALDVVAHELHHELTALSSGLEYTGMSGALNESFSDVAGTLAEIYREGDAADFLIGEDIVKGDGALRSLCDPPADGVSIDHAADLARDMNVHHASGVGNKAFCLAVARFRAATGESTAAAAQRAGTAWYLANTMFWTSTATFTDGCQGVVDAARTYQHLFSADDVTALVQSWADVGVECGVRPELCDGDDACEVESGETCASCPGDCGSCAEDCSRWKKAKCKLGRGDCSRCGLPDGCGDGVCTADETDENCGQDCGCAAPGATCGSVAPAGCWCDDSCDDAGDCCADADACG
jgi:pseudolysin/vibriolysin